MDNRDLIPAIFLYTGGSEGIDGATRFQKLVFLAQQEGEIPEVFEYTSEQYGPFSPGLANTLELLEHLGYVERDRVRNEIGNAKFVYSLTLDGVQRVQEVLQSGTLEEVFEGSDRVKSTYNEWNLERLLRYVYQKYPEYATDTELDTDRLFDPAADSEYLDPSGDRGASEIVSEPEVPHGDGITAARVFENGDGTWTARDVDAELTAQGETRLDALENLALVIAATNGDAGHEPTDEEIRELGVDPEQARNPAENDVPEYMG